MNGIPYAEWKARYLNELFRNHGVLGVAARIKAATVTDGLIKNTAAPVPCQARRRCKAENSTVSKDRHETISQHTRRE